MPQTAPPAKPAPLSATGSQGRRGHELDLGGAMDVDKLDQQVVDPVIFKSVLEGDEMVILGGHA